MSEEQIGWNREQMAERAAQDIPNGSYVNLGIGIPEKVVRYVPDGTEVIYHTENGLLGMGDAPKEGQEDPELINAGKKLVTAIPGASYFHHADSFSMIRVAILIYACLVQCRLRKMVILLIGRLETQMRYLLWVGRWIWWPVLKPFA